MELGVYSSGVCMPLICTSLSHCYIARVTYLLKYFSSGILELLLETSPNKPHDTSATMLEGERIYNRHQLDPVATLV